MLAVIDPGHGGTDPGAQSAIGLWEAHFMLGLAFGVVDELEAKGHKILLTRSRDTDISLQKRAEVANQANAACFISLHWNAATFGEANGSQVFYYPGSQPGQQLADAIFGLIRGLDGDESERWERTEGKAFYVLRNTSMPSVLVETEFATNEAEARRLANPFYLARLATEIANGVVEWAGARMLT